MTEPTIQEKVEAVFKWAGFNDMSCLPMPSDTEFLP